MVPFAPLTSPMLFNPDVPLALEVPLDIPDDPVVPVTPADPPDMPAPPPADPPAEAPPAPPPAPPPLPPPCASANVLDRATTAANAIVVSFMFIPFV